eukprot:3710135-Rhodomonas_salina.2
MEVYLSRYPAVPPSEDSSSDVRPCESLVQDHQHWSLHPLFRRRGRCRRAPTGLHGVVCKREGPSPLAPLAMR